MAGERLGRRLARRRLPESLGNRLGQGLSLLLPWLQVSIHLIAEKAAGRARKS
jgi:hypothetical protein